MAMDKKQGYNPYEELISYNYGDKVSEKWGMTRNVLKHRLSHFVYPNAGYSYKGAYLVDALKFATGILGLQVACTLDNFISEKEYGKKGVPIICLDVVNPYQIPVEIQESKGEWILSTPEATTDLQQDERYLVVIQKKETEVHMYFYKK